MLDFWKDIIGHVLSWPVAALLLGLLFQKPLKDLIGRINHVKTPAFDFSAPQPPASAQIAEVSTAPEALKKGEIGSTTSNTSAPTIAPSGVEAVLEEKREAVRKFGGGFKIVDEAVATIKNELAALGMPLSSEETGEILVRHLAATQLMVRCERTHRLIFGSQLLALQMINYSGPQPETALSSIFENARSKEPQFYGSYSFEDWLGFLIKEIAVVKTDQGLYGITVYGQNYLEYIGVFAPGPRPH